MSHFREQFAKEAGEGYNWLDYLNRRLQRVSAVPISANGTGESVRRKFSYGVAIRPK
ncbi:MAG: hypothetical protein GX777_00505 [Fastidiosipila sp.]|nr:hypothetical protein [Fastidiosipila sp.]